MENFLEYILMVLPALRIDSFPAQTRPQLKPATASPANGTIAWKLQATGQTHKKWEAENLNQEG